MFKDQSFYQLLREASENAVEVANRLDVVLSEPGRVDEIGPSIKELERKGDAVTHDLFALIHRSFVVPLKREDLAALAVRIDSVTDAMEAASARIGIYRPAESDRYLKEFGNILRAQCAHLVSVMDLLAANRLNQMTDLTHQINQLENQGDETLREGLRSLYAQAPADPVRFVTMKEIYDILETATDRVEDVADILEGIIMKNA